MNQQSFLILHGLGGSGPDHWQTWLYQELTKRNYSVFYPTFSNLNSPNKKEWLRELSTTMERIPKQHKLTVITHSLGCLLWIHYAALKNMKIADQTILVAPPSPTIVLSEAKTFYPVPLNGNHLLNVAKETLFIHSTNDPYCSIEDSKHYTNLGVSSLEFPNMGHINTDSGYVKWQWILEFCMETSKTAVPS